MAKNKSLPFFATKSDIESLLRALESSMQLQFALSGTFCSSSVESVSSLLATSDLGCVSDANGPIYLVALCGTLIEARTISLSDGSVRYAVDQLANPATIVLRPGGVLREMCLIAGQLGTATDNPASLELFRIFSRQVRRQFAKLKSFFVGPEARELLDRGWRLTANVKSPPIYDLKSD